MSKVYLDDVRMAPDGWIRTKTAPETINLLKKGGINYLSLDHDLGENSGVGCGYDVLLWIEEQVFTNGFVPPRITIHSDNSGARPKMKAAIEKIYRLHKDNLIKGLSA
jgi:hypothetical protein